MRRAAREGLGWEERPPERLPDRPSTVDRGENALSTSTLSPLPTVL